MHKDSDFYILKHKNDDVCKIRIAKHGQILEISEIICIEKMPYGTVNRNEADLSCLSSWWKRYAISAERDSVRKALINAGISGPEEFKLLSRGLSLTNHYWVCREGENTKWEDVNFWDNGMSDEIGYALFRHKPVPNGLTRFLSPDSSTGGMLDKRWKEMDGSFWLLKGGSGRTADEVYNEVLASDLADAYGIPHVKYDLQTEEGDVLCKCICMTSKDSELVHASDLLNFSGPDNPYSAESHKKWLMDSAKSYGFEVSERQMSEILVIDYILAGTDRHYNNIAFLVSEKEKKLAPLYDSGTCLWCTSNRIADPLKDSDIMARPFGSGSYTTWEEQRELITYCPALDVSKYEEAVTNYAFYMRQYGDFSEKRISELCNAVVQRTLQLERMLESKGIAVPGKLDEDYAASILEKITCGRGISD